MQDFYKLFWLFMIGAFLGDITETIYCRITGGIWMSRSSVVWGPFSIVWGLGLVIATIILYPFRKKSNWKLFLAGAVFGGLFEYFCSLFTEHVFGKVFWDYSHIPFNINGRVNLLYCLFWGVAAVVWVNNIYPFISTWITKIPLLLGKSINRLAAIFMILNVLVSGIALVRSDERKNGIEATYSWQRTMDTKFDDYRLSKIYPNMIHLE